jgi:hypothetical protein
MRGRQPQVALKHVQITLLNKDSPELLQLGSDRSVDGEYELAMVLNRSDCYKSARPVKLGLVQARSRRFLAR